MELTSFYQNVFYTSSLGEGVVCEEEQPYHLQHSYSPETPSYQQSSCPSSPPTCSSVSPSSELTSPACSPSPRQFGQQKTQRIPKIPPLEVLQQRRLAANARERKRANKINFAFNRLRKVLPGFSDREISKFEAIQLARNYIAQLSSVLQSDQDQRLERQAGEELKQF